jgi:HPt (histidine-containing phosphotransfer) domain-containing protein
LLDLVQSCFDKIDEIVEAVQADDKKDNVEFMHARMHELKGMCYNFGLKEIGDYCRDGENAAADGDIEPAKLAIEKLPALKDKAKAEIQGWLSAS